MKAFLDRLQNKPLPVHIPTREGLRRQHPEQLFHLTPELFLQKSGYTEFSFPADRFDLRANEVALIPRGIPHGEMARHQKTCHFQGLVFCFDERPNAGAKVSLLLTKASPESRPTTDFFDAFEAPEIMQAIRYLDDASAVFSKSFTTAEARRRSLIFASISLIYDALAHERLADREEAHGHPKVKQCCELIELGLPDPALSVKSLARDLGCTPDHLSRCFHREMGMPVLAYLQQQRIALAKNLMQYPKANISEIAWACGFNSLNYFVRLFRRATGHPPRVYRQTLSRPMEGDARG